MAMVAEDVARAKTEADLVVVVYHWGTEDIPYPQPFNPLNDLEAIARQTIDLGASVVLGTHPHAVQGYETYGGGLIAYSLGNFVNDQRRDTQKESMILELQMGPSGVLSARVTPCWIISTQPRFMQGDEARRLLEKIEEISAGFRDHQ
jgi:poly-gamma-glutamate synthesis protein (capsule biosynthesis protein)